ncbi:MAG TPA: DNA gyrase modulator, partial [Candidatus Acidoferrales bacterium]|nr:DNA gyrase modulator [Candidatus Acidoferrales bacterium]
MSPTKQRTKKPAPRARRAGRAAPTATRLLSEAQLHRLAERVFKLSEADETEVQIDVTSDALTRFANNTIHQNVAEEALSISVRTVFDGRTARATTNKTDEQSLRRIVAASSSLVRSRP